jgi:hypothetical protein
LLKGCVVGSGCEALLENRLASGFRTLVHSCCSDEHVYKFDVGCGRDVGQTVNRRRARTWPGDANGKGKEGASLPKAQGLS